MIHAFDVTPTVTLSDENVKLLKLEYVYVKQALTKIVNDKKAGKLDEQLIIDLALKRGKLVTSYVMDIAYSVVQDDDDGTLFQQIIGCFLIKEMIDRDIV